MGLPVNGSIVGRLRFFADGELLEVFAVAFVAVLDAVVDDDAVFSMLFEELDPTPLVTNRLAAALSTFNDGLSFIPEACFNLLKYDFNRIISVFTACC